MWMVAANYRRTRSPSSPMMSPSIAFNFNDDAFATARSAWRSYGLQAELTCICQLIKNYQHKRLCYCTESAFIRVKFQVWTMTLRSTRTRIPTQSQMWTRISIHTSRPLFGIFHAFPAVEISSGSWYHCLPIRMCL